jgi:phage baseplate assembly protein W
MDKIIGYTTVDQLRSAKYLTDIDLAKQDLKNHFGIRKGEKWTNPEFGSDLPLYVFEPLDDSTLDLINDDVNQVVSYDPRFELASQQAIVNRDQHTVTVLVKLIYLPTTTPTDLVLKFDDEFGETVEF